MARKNAFVPSLFLIGAITFILFSNLHLSKQKNFSVDESYEMNISCASSTGEIIAHGGTNQCSPNPLYYIFQKWSVESLLHGQFDQSILWKYRVVSLASSALLAIALVLGAWASFGFYPAIVSLLALMNAAIYQAYSAENRPYMLWVFLFASAFFWACSCVKTIKKPILGFLALVSLTLVSGAGGVQALALLAGVFLLNRTNVKLIGSMMLVMLGTSAYYGRFSCTYTDAGVYDLLVTRHWGLITQVLTLLWQSPTHPIGFIFDAFFLIGLICPLLKKTSGAIKTTHFHLCLQLLASVAIGGLVAIKHYYFIERIFIFLVFLKAIGVGLGSYFFIQITKDWFEKHAFKYGKALGVILITIFASSVLVAFLKQEKTTINISEKEIMFSNPNSLDCTKLMKGYYGYVPLHSNEDRFTNSIVAFSRLMNGCKKKSSLETMGYVFFKADQSIEVLDALPVNTEGFVPLTQIGKQFPIVSK